MTSKPKNEVYMKMSRDINTEMDEIGDEVLILHMILFQFIYWATKVMVK